jgi:glycosyltransferase involved in cell wall biosynthesis
MKDNLNILFVSHHRRSKAHLKNRSMAMARYLSDRGHHVTILVTSDNQKIKTKRESVEGVEIIEIPDLLWGKLRSGWDIWSGFIRLLYLLKNSKKYDIIHLFESRPAVVHPVQIMRLFYKVPVVIDWVDWIGHGGIMEVLRPAWYRMIFGGFETFYEEYFKRKFEGVTVICETLKIRAKDLNIKEERILKLPIGSEVFNKSADMDKLKCREALNISKSAKILTFSGVDAVFDFPIILETLKLLLKEDDKYRLMITGNAGDNILRLIKENDLADQILLTGFLPYEKFYTYLACADIFLLPFPDTIYNKGRWPSKINDYLVVGRPIMTNAVGDLIDLFSKYKIGATVEYNAKDFAGGISKILSDEKLCDECCQNAVFVAKQVLGWPRLVIELEQFYQKIISTDDEKTNI